MTCLFKNSYDKDMKKYLTSYTFNRSLKNPRQTQMQGRLVDFGRSIFCRNPWKIEYENEVCFEACRLPNFFWIVLRFLEKIMNCF